MYFYCSMLNGLSGKMKMETVYERTIRTAVHSMPLRKVSAVNLPKKQKSELKI